MADVSRGGLRFGTVSTVSRQRLLVEAQRAPFSYDHVGSTLDPERCDGPGVSRSVVEVGTGAAAFTAARHALRTWVPQRGIGAEIHPPAQAVAPGATVLVLPRLGPVGIVAPDRVVDVIDEPRRFAFAYGTLVGHPERGEESFTAEHLDDDRVTFTIRVHAGPGTLAAQVAAPLVRWLQAAALRGYLRAVADDVAASSNERSRSCA